MIFSELYSAYYNTVAAVLREAVRRPLGKGELRAIVEENAFGESVLNVIPALTGQKWRLLLPDGSTPLENVPTMPKTTLEKRWLKAVCSDPRMRLFSDSLPDYPDVEPLFTQEDFRVFDKYSDGDPYEDENYIKTFRLVLDAVKNKYPLSIEMTGRSGGTTRFTLAPGYLEYSEKDDKFRLIGRGKVYGKTVNLARIVKCEKYGKPFDAPKNESDSEKRDVVFILTDERNALERAMLHFAHFEKEAERLDGGRYRVRVTYRKEDETELVIRVLMFGPMIKAESPDSFVELIKERLIKQKNCGL